MPFDLDSYMVTGDQFSNNAGEGYPTMSTEGTLVYRSTQVAGPLQMVWVDRQGKIGASLGADDRTYRAQIIT